VPRTQEYEATVTIRLEVMATMSVKAGDEDTAAALVQSWIEEGLFSLTWQPPQEASARGIDFSDGDQSIEVDEVSEVDA
jgi:hypothetical protein